MLQRTWLLPRDGTSDPSTEAKFSLDAVIGDEGKRVLHRSVSPLTRILIGSNYSAGERQLLSLCRALVKNSRIIVLVSWICGIDVSNIPHDVPRTRRLVT